MAKNEKKQSFLGGAAILAAAVVAVKFIGFFYKIPLNNILGAEGKSHFQAAYNIYNVLLTISTAGLPLAISKLTSEAHALGRENEKRKLFRTSIWLFFALGLAGSLLMFFGAENLSSLVEGGQTLAAWPIRALAPAVFCVCLLACMRGYTQGQGNMKPTAVSQVLEAMCKLCLGLPLAWYLLKLGMGLEMGAAGAILGVSFGTLLSMLFLIFYLMRHRNTTQALDTPPSGGTLLRRVLAIGIPITLSNSAMSIITLIDNALVLDRLGAVSSVLATTPLALNGQYSMAMDLINLPASFVYPVTMSLIPFAAAAMARRDAAGANRIVSSGFRIIALLALPAGIGLSVLSTPICKMLYPLQMADALAAGVHLRTLGFACILICLMILTNAILQSYGHENLPILTVAIGGTVKVVMNYVLVGNAAINIHGAPISTLCCYAVIAGLNLFFIWKYSPEKPKYFSIFAKPLAASVLMGGAAWGVQGLLQGLLAAGHSDFGATVISTLGGIGAGVVVYGIMVLALRILSAEDLAALPKGDKIAKFLRIR